MAAPLLLLALTVLRLVVAAYTPLSADEAYYWVWSRALAESYLDHPPMVALWIRIGTFFAGETALGVRLLGPLAAAAGSFLLAGTAEALFPGRRLGIPAAVSAERNADAGRGRGDHDAGHAAGVLRHAWRSGRWRGCSADGRWWLLVGAALGLALDSKYTAVLIGAGIPLWLAWVPQLRGEFRRPWLWAGGAVAVLLFAPVVAWNAQHGWASFARQGGRTGDWHPAAAGRYVGELLLSQLGLVDAAAVRAVRAPGFGGRVRAAWGRRDPSWSLLAATERARIAGVSAARAGRPGAGELGCGGLPAAGDRRGGVRYYGGGARRPGWGSR